MKSHELKTFATGLYVDCYDTLSKAGKEYAGGTDALDNFKLIASIVGVEPRQVAFTYLMKHVISIGKGVSIREGMRGRVVDAINYLYIIAALDKETEIDQTGDLSPVPDGRVSTVPDPLGQEPTLEVGEQQSVRSVSPDWLSHCPRP